jgi:acetylornithine/succinyldiaminopimelate/putrescine aminotransferase
VGNNAFEFQFQMYAFVTLRMNHREMFLRHVAQTSTAPLAIEVVKAEGVLMWDEKGKEYLDIIGGISVCNIGHRHPEVIKAIHQQADQYLHVMVYGELVQSPQVRYAAALASHLPSSLDAVYFTSSGSEATEGAMKLAKRVTGRTEIVAFADSYHGSTQGALSVMGDEYWRNAFRPLLPGISHEQYGEMNALNRITTQTAMVIAETIQAEKGVNVPTKEWLQALRKRCDETGALLVLDEIQAGFGRTGSLWAFEQFDIVPDILLLGKALGGGLPLGAFVASQSMMNQLAVQPVLGHITTFGGHPLSCAAGLAGFNVLIKEQLFQQAKEKAALFTSLLQHPTIKHVRTFGLLIAVEFDSYEENKKIIDACIERGVFTDWFLFASHCMRIAPPLTINEAEIRKACAIILEAVGNC